MLISGCVLGNPIISVKNVNPNQNGVVLISQNISCKSTLHVEFVGNGKDCVKVQKNQVLYYADCSGIKNSMYTTFGKPGCNYLNFQDFCLEFPHVFYS